MWTAIQNALWGKGGMFSSRARSRSNWKPMASDMLLKQRYRYEQICTAPPKTD